MSGRRLQVSFSILIHLQNYKYNHKDIENMTTSINFVKTIRMNKPTHTRDVLTFLNYHLHSITLSI